MFFTLPANVQSDKSDQKFTALFLLLCGEKRKLSNQFTIFQEVVEWTKDSAPFLLHGHDLERKRSMLKLNNERFYPLFF